MQGDHAVAGNERILGKCRGTCDSKLFCDCTCVDSVLGDEGRVFLMEAQRYIELLCLLHGLIDEFLIHQRDSIVRKSNGSCCLQSVHIGQFLALHSNGNAGCRKNVDACLLSLFDDVF